MTTKMRLVKFGSKTCGACIAMERAKTLEKFASEFPDVQIIKLDVSDESGESPPAVPDDPTSIDYKKNYAISDKYEIEALPTLVFEVEGAGEIARIEGAANLKQLRELMEETLDYAKRSEVITW